tara:strand:+ start:417 stop:1091 length:675 start_codon:yes stop_codon:yes gene_type:complete
MEIRDIVIGDIRVNDIIIPNWMTNPPQSIPPVVPATQQIGSPVINIPGCVEAHLDNKKGTNDKLTDDDPKGARVFCDGNMPSYNPIDYTPENLTITRPAEVPKVPTPKAPEVPTPEIPKTAPPVTAIVEEEPEPEPEIPWVEKYLPAPEAATTTAAIAVVATTSALLAKPLADLLLRVIKPTVKKVIKKISQIGGKKVKIESLRERRGQQRIRNKAIRILKGRE